MVSGQRVEKMSKKTTFSKQEKNSQSPTNTPTLPPIDSRPSTTPLHSAVCQYCYQFTFNLQQLKRRDSHSHKHAVVVPAPGRVPEREKSQRIRPPTPGPPSARGKSVVSAFFCLIYC